MSSSCPSHYSSFVHFNNIHLKNKKNRSAVKVEYVQISDTFTRIKSEKKIKKKQQSERDNFVNTIKQIKFKKYNPK